MHLVAVPFLMFTITRSHTWVGAVAFAQLIPTLLITPISGVIADRSNRKTVLIATLLAQSLIAVAFAMLWHADALTAWRILLLSSAMGIAEGFQLTIWQSFIPMLVPRNLIPTAVRLNSMQFTASRAIGPIVGAGLIALLGYSAVFIANSLTFTGLIVAIGIATVRNAQPEPTQQTTLRVFTGGISYVLTSKALLLAVAVGFAYSFFGRALVQTAAGLAEEAYSAGSAGLAGFITSVGLGALAMSGFLIVKGDRYRLSSVATSGFGCYAIALVLVSATSVYSLGLVGFVLMGCAHAAIAISANTVIQTQVAESFRGRVLSIYLMGVFGGLPLGALAAGYIGDVFDIRLAYLAASVVTACIFWIAVIMPKLRALLDSPVSPSN